MSDTVCRHEWNSSKGVCARCYDEIQDDNEWLRSEIARVHLYYKPKLTASEPAEPPASLSDLNDCPFCGYSQWMSCTSDSGVRIECGQCGASITGWCHDRKEARWMHASRMKQYFADPPAAEPVSFPTKVDDIIRYTVAEPPACVGCVKGWARVPDKWTPGIWNHRRPGLMRQWNWTPCTAAPASEPPLCSVCRRRHGPEVEHPCE